MTNPFYLSMSLYDLYQLALDLYDTINDAPGKKKAPPQAKSRARFQMLEVAEALRVRLNDLNDHKPIYSGFEVAVGMPVIILRTYQKGVIAGLNTANETVMVQFDQLELLQDYKPEDFMLTLPNKIRDYAQGINF